MWSLWATVAGSARVGQAESGESGEKTWSRKAQEESAGCGTSQGAISQMAARRLDAGKRHSKCTSRDYQDKGWPVSLQEL